MSYDLFSGLSNNANFFSDWASIKNGSYSKLLKAHYSNLYGEEKSTGSTSSSRTSSTNIIDKLIEERKHPTVSKEVQEANSELPSRISTLSSTVNKLQNKDTFQDSEDGGKKAADKVVAAMKDYVAAYNDTISAAKKSTLDRQTSNVAAVMKATNAHAAELSEIGVKINADGTLLLDETALKKADISKVQDLFSNDDIIGYGSTVKSRLGFSQASSSSVSGTTTEKADETEEEEDKQDQLSAAASLLSDIDKLTGDSLFAQKTGEDGKKEYDLDAIFSAAKSFVKNYNAMMDFAGTSLNSGVRSNLAWIKNKTSDRESMLERYGITLDNDGRLKIDEDTFKKSDMSRVQSFFKSYGDSISKQVSLVDYYMRTQANESSGYNEGGGYNVQGSAFFSDYV